MVLAEEAGVEAAGLGKLRLGDDLVDAAIEVLSAGRIRDRAVETEFHGSPLGESRSCRTPLPWNLSFDKLCEESERFLPAEIASFRWDGFREPLLYDAHLSSARDRV